MELELEYCDPRAIYRLNKFQTVFTSKKEGLKRWQIILFWILLAINVVIIISCASFAMYLNLSIWDDDESGRIEVRNIEFDRTGNVIARAMLKSAGIYLIHSRVAYECKTPILTKNRTEYYTHRVRIAKMNIEETDHVNKMAVTGNVDPPSSGLICYDGHIVFEAEVVDGSEVTSHSDGGDDHLLVDLEVLKVGKRNYER